jgi:saccharopine dehydrogenase-like NADP-dependent oxidoreductase
MRRLLILGAGLVSRPIIRDFLDRGGYEVTVATLVEEHARALIAGHPAGRAVAVDADDDRALDRLVGQADLVVSLLPFAYHPQVARSAIRHRISMVTTSYISREMEFLHDEAREAGVMILNEIGLDPGIDHISSLRTIDEIRDSGGRLDSFSSCTGGLPSPEAADNPWRYKFSWSPRGALLAGRNDARYLKDGRVIEIRGPDLFDHYWPYPVETLGDFEVYPNRDSLRYVELYGLEGIGGMLRGTIRYPGWSRTMKVLADLGMFAVAPRDWPADATYASVTEAGIGPGSDSGALRQRLARRFGLTDDDDVLVRIAWAGLLDGDRLPNRHLSPLDALAHRLQERMAYSPGERDMVVMRHRFEASWPDGRREARISLLVTYGEPHGDSATSRTVSLPAAAAVRSILEERLVFPGVRLPLDRRLYLPILAELERAGIAFREWTLPLD